jgi:hypothetical protein
MRDGIIARGGLIDLPAFRGVPFVAPGDAVTAADFEAWRDRIGRQSDRHLLSRTAATRMQMFATWLLPLLRARSADWIGLLERVRQPGSARTKR